MFTERHVPFEQVLLSYLKDEAPEAIIHDWLTDHSRGEFIAYLTHMSSKYTNSTLLWQKEIKNYCFLRILSHVGLKETKKTCQKYLSSIARHVKHISHSRKHKFPTFIELKNLLEISLKNYYNIL